MTKSTVIAGALELSPAERLEVIEELWESLDSDDARALPEELRIELDARLAEHRRNPSDVISWDDVKQNILKR